MILPDISTIYSTPFLDGWSHHVNIMPDLPHIHLAVNHRTILTSRWFILPFFRRLRHPASLVTVARAVALHCQSQSICRFFDKREGSFKTSASNIQAWRELMNDAAWNQNYIKKRDSSNNEHVFKKDQQLNIRLYLQSPDSWEVSYPYNERKVQLFNFLK
jgi:hypothetical protein